MRQADNVGTMSLERGSGNGYPAPDLTQAGPNKNVKIAIVTEALHMGGAEHLTVNLGRGLQQLGYEVTIAVTSNPGELFGLIERTGIRALHIDSRFQCHTYRHAWRVGRRLREENFNVVITTNCERFAQAALNMLPAHVIAIPWIHGDEEHVYRKSLFNSHAWNVAVGVGVKVAKTAARMSRGKEVLHIPNGLEQPSAELLRFRRAADVRPFRLCYLGRMFQSHKNIFSLPSIIDLCLKRQFDVVLDLVGDGQDRAELEQRFVDVGLMDRVVFHGALPRDQVFRFLCQSHVLLLPSYSEAMPSVPVEAQFCGCVPIVSRLPGVTDTIMDDGQTGILVDVADINGFVEAIGGLVNDRARWQAMSEAGPRRTAEFTIEAMAQRFDQLIQACLRGEYPLQRPRRVWLPVNPLVFAWREAIPRSIHRLGIGRRFRALLGISEPKNISSSKQRYHR